MKIKRPPVVVFLGHVDHGKTTLQDVIRNTNIALREAGGITQSTSFSKVKTPEGEIVMIDTPGHAAFAKMRQRGAKFADVAVLVVAADAGVKPQTLEALSCIRQEKIPFLVAITKTDLATANPESVKGQLEKEGVLFEGRGGDVPVVEVSAKEGKGISDLLELIHLLGEINEISGDPDSSLKAYILESRKDKKGLLVSVIVVDGTLSLGMNISGGGVQAKVRGLFDVFGKPVKKALPGDPVNVLGFLDVPEVGSLITSDGESKKESLQELKKATPPKVDKEQLGVIVKAKEQGALEAVVASVPQNVVVLDASVGDVVESDVFFAKTSNAKIITFGSGASQSVLKLADTEGVEIIRFDIIYELIKFLEEEVDKLKNKVVGKAQILAIFPFDGQKVVGCKVIEGVIKKGVDLTIMRRETEIGRAKAVSVKRGKEPISQAKSGEECGILLQPQFDFKPGDVLLSLTK